MTQERAYQIATEVVFKLDEDGYWERWELVRQSAELAKSIQDAAFFQRMYPLKDWYERINQEINELKADGYDDDDGYMLELKELLEMLDEWEEEAV